MPLDARSLLRASSSNSSASGSNGVGPAQGAIADRFASYHPKTRSLRCTACDYQTVKHESLWSSHTASKSHRQNVQAIRRQEEQKKAQEGVSAPADDKAGQATASNDITSTAKRRHDGEQAGTNDRSKRPKSTDSSRDMHLSSNEIDSEWERFQAEVLNAGRARSSDIGQGYANAGATIEVEPMLRKLDRGALSDVDEPDDDEAFAAQAEETEEEKRERLDREEREDIIARLEDEQRQQEEADERASALRARYETMRRARAERKRAQG